MGEFETIFLAIGDAFIMIYILIGFIAVFTILLIIAIAKQIKSRKEHKPVPMALRICTYIIIGILILLFSPVIMELLL